MTARKMILLTLAFLLPCGLLILVLRSVFKSSFAERSLKAPQAVSGMTELRGIVSRGMVPSESVKGNLQETTNSKTGIL